MQYSYSLVYVWGSGGCDYKDYIVVTIKIPGLHPNIFYTWVLFWNLICQCWKVCLFLLSLKVLSTLHLGQLKLLNTRMTEFLTCVLGLKSQSKRAVSSTPPRPPSRRGRVMADKVGTSSSGGESSSKTISVPVFHLYHKLLPGNFNSCFKTPELLSFSVADMSSESRYNANKHFYLSIENPSGLVTAFN